MKKCNLILLILISIFLLPLVSGFTCDQGDVSTVCNLTSIYQFTDGEIINATNIIIKSGGSILTIQSYPVITELLLF